MNITRRSVHSGTTRTFDLDITEDEMQLFEAGVPVKRAFPRLTPAEREFVLSGMTEEESAEQYPPTDEFAEPDEFDEDNDGSSFWDDIEEEDAFNREQFG